MSNGILEELNENIKKLINIFEVYPNPIDEVKPVTKTAEKNEEPKTEQDVEVQETEVVTGQTISDADLQGLVKKINETGEKGKLKDIKAYITKIGFKKVTDVTQEHRIEFVEFLEGLL